MEPITVASAVSAVGGMVGMLVTARVRRHRAREAARRDHLRYLPPGSRIVDLGDRGLTIEVGDRVAVRELAGDDRR
jgi:hypothetical protein